MTADVQLEYTGTDFLPPADRDPDLRPVLRSLRRAHRGERPAGGHRYQGPGVVPVFTNARGDEFAVLPTAGGPLTAPWVSGSRSDPETDRATAGGFLARAEVERRHCPGGP